jgi:cytochrome P450
MTTLSADDIRLATPEFWTQPEEEREAAFATLRRDKPVSFHEELAYTEGVPPGPGFWAITRYEDVWTASRHPDVFQSGRGVNIGDLPTEISEFFGSMIAMDAPRHTKLRGIVSRGFTPKAVASVEAAVRDKAKEIVDRVAPTGGCDFVSEIAAALPLEIICDMMGIPVEDRHRVFELTNTILGIGDPEYGVTLESLVAAGGELYQYAFDLGSDRLASPTDDITSKLMHAEVDGERITAQEFGSFVVLLVVAGNETTRNAMAHGMHQLLEHPEQYATIVDDPSVMETATEEIVRWASPVMYFRRNATSDIELTGQQIEAGDKLSIWYASANRDEEVFDDPFRFDILRSPNDHVGFGGGGPHFCLGAGLARTQITSMVRELLRRFPSAEFTAPPRRMRSDFINGIKHMPIRFHLPTARP